MDKNAVSTPTDAGTNPDLAQANMDISAPNAVAAANNRAGGGH
jgi:hypothetical protein